MVIDGDEVEVVLQELRREAVALVVKSKSEKYATHGSPLKFGSGRNSSITHI